MVERKTIQRFQLQNALLVGAISDLKQVVNKLFLELASRLPSDKLLEAQGQVTAILRDAKRAAGSAATYIRIIASDQSITPAFASVIVARVVLYLISSRIGINRVIHSMLSLAMFTLLPAVYQRISSGASEKGSNETLQHYFKRALKEVPEMTQDVYFLIRAYWRLGKRIFDLARVVLPLVAQSGESWLELGQLLKKLLMIREKIKS